MLVFVRAKSCRDPCKRGQNPKTQISDLIPNSFYFVIVGILSSRRSVT